MIDARCEENVRGSVTNTDESILDYLLKGINKATNSNYQV